MDHDARRIDRDFSLRHNCLMVVMMDLDAQVFKLSDQELDFMLLWIRSHVAQFLVALAADDFINRPRDPIGHGYLCLIG